MLGRNSRANATEVNKTPRRVRYVFILSFGNDRGQDVVGATTTFKTLKENTSLAGLETVRAVDLKNNLIKSIRLDMVGALLDEWRDNYHDYDWDIPYQMLV